MNRRMLFLAIAAVSGLAAQTVTSRVTATVPVPFDFQGTTMAAGQYEVVQTASASNGLVFEKAGNGYYFRAMQDAGTALAYIVSRTRKQVEQARNMAPERVYIAAR